MNSPLCNKGSVIIGDPANKNKPIVVVGTARGGTSMIAGALAKLGVFMGDESVHPVYEDVRLARAFESNNEDEVRAIVNDYNLKSTKWAWKRPSSIDYLGKVGEALGGPLFIFIFKDILSIAQRNSISMLSEIVPSMRSVLSQYSDCLDFIEENDLCAMLISYDKAVADPIFLVNSLVQFYDLDPSEEQIQSAIEFVRPNPFDYLDASRITKAQGFLDGVENNKIWGWARFVHIRKPAEVEIIINGKVEGSLIANLKRQDLSEKFDQPCAFEYTIPANCEGRLEIRAKVVDEVVDLNCSPLFYDKS
jgi:hypothetical protein